MGVGERYLPTLDCSFAEVWDFCGEGAPIPIGN